jgi:hypothetical protein
MPNREAYNKMQADIRHKNSSMIKHFRETNPEAYERLLKKAKGELQLETIRTPLERLQVRPGVSSTPSRTDEEWTRLLFKAGERHFNILTGDGHFYFEGASVNATHVELLKLAQAHASFNGIIELVARCSCVNCRRRDIEENTPYDYTLTQKLHDVYYNHRPG